MRDIESFAYIYLVKRVYERCECSSMLILLEIHTCPDVLGNDGPILNAGSDADRSGTLRAITQSAWATYFKRRIISSFSEHSE